MSEIEDKLYDINLFLKDLENKPCTYNTFLGDERKNGTYQRILRRKLNNCQKLGQVFKAFIPGSRFGNIIFYVIPKTYTVAVIAGRVANKTIYFREHQKIGKFHIGVDEYYELDGYKWIERHERLVIFTGSVLKWI